MTDHLDPAGSSGVPPVQRVRGRERALAEDIFLGPNGIRAGWRAALYAAFFILIELALQSLIALDPFAGVADLLRTPEVLLVRELVLIAGALGAAQIMALIEGRAVGAYGIPWRGAFRARFWQGTVWGIAQLSAVMLLIAAWHGYTVGGLALGGSALIEYALRWAAVFLAVGFAEEFLFRGYLLFTLAEGMGFWPTALLLSLMFGAVHLRNPGEGVVGALSVFTIGMFLCLTLRRTGDLWLAIGWHAAFDFGETYLYSVPNSGLVMQGHLLSASLHGPRWLTGGSVGPEGSAFSFAVLAVVAASFNFIYRPNKEASESRREPTK
jgi:membrane protease YdiL (CAAX protease family)